MTEKDWLEATNPLVMLDHVRGTASDRKLRLFACACCRRRGVGDVVALGEGYADGLASAADLAVLHDAAQRGGVVQYKTWRIRVSRQVAWLVAEATQMHAWDAAVGTLRNAAEHVRDFQCRLLRELFGNPFRPATIPPEWLAWEGQIVVRLAQDIYEARAWEQLPILADALEEAGCTAQDILSHCRTECVHVRGCWVLDALLGKT